MEQKAKASPLIFVASILCFLFPFVTLSCGGQRVASFTGVQLAIGTSIQEPQAFGPPRKHAVESDPMAALAVLCVMAGIGLGFVRKAALASAISGALGTLALLLMKSRIEDQMLQRGGGMIQVEYGAGFYLALLLLVAGVAWNAFLFSPRKHDSAKGVPLSPPPLGDVPVPPGQSPPA